jgi:3-deoxy-manno-octulosonate cytidylyltransferase (CMP-KDO synthetase)
MVEWSYAVGVASGAHDVLVAADDDRIVSTVEGFGGRAMLTGSEHVSGTERLAEAAGRMGWGDDEIVVNLQCDEPALPPEHLVRVAENLAAHSAASLATLATPIVDPAELFNPNVVKVVRRGDALAMYFSRAPIPWSRDGFASYAQGSARATRGPRLEGQTHLRHIGIYAYRAGALKALARAPSCTEEKLESLEQLRAIFIGLQIHVGLIDGLLPNGVDTPEDAARMDEYLKGAG